MLSQKLFIAPMQPRWAWFLVLLPKQKDLVDGGETPLSHYGNSPSSSLPHLHCDRVEVDRLLWCYYSKLCGLSPARGPYCPDSQGIFSWLPDGPVMIPMGPGIGGERRFEGCRLPGFSFIGADLNMLDFFQSSEGDAFDSILPSLDSLSVSGQINP